MKLFTIILIIFLFSYTVVSAQVDSETVNDYQQVYYQSNGQKIFITGGNSNHRMPNQEGDYITYVQDINGAGQIFRYHIPTQTTVQLTFNSTNLQPAVDASGHIAWESWVDETQKWQIFYFDGARILQLTSGDISVNADIENDIVVFDRFDRITDLWRTVAKSMPDGKTIDITLNPGATHPRLNNKQLELTDQTGKRKLMAMDIKNLFQLDLIPLSVDSPPTVNSDQIIQELTSDTPTPTPTPEITSLPTDSTF